MQCRLFQSRVAAPPEQLVPLDCCWKHPSLRLQQHVFWSRVPAPHPNHIARALLPLVMLPAVSVARRCGVNRCCPAAFGKGSRVSLLGLRLHVFRQRGADQSSVLPRSPRRFPSLRLRLRVFWRGGPSAIVGTAALSSGLFLTQAAAACVLAGWRRRSQCVLRWRPPSTLTPRRCPAAKH